MHYGYYAPQKIHRSTHFDSALALIVTKNVNKPGPINSSTIFLIFSEIARMYFITLKNSIKKGNNEIFKKKKLRKEN